MKSEIKRHTLSIGYEVQEELPNAPDKCLRYSICFRNHKWPIFFSVNSLRLKLSPKLSIILPLMSLSPKMKKNKPIFAFPSIATLCSIWGSSQN